MSPAKSLLAFSKTLKGVQNQRKPVQQLCCESQTLWGRWLSQAFAKDSEAFIDSHVLEHILLSSLSWVSMLTPYFMVGLKSEVIWETAPSTRFSWFMMFCMVAILGRKRERVIWAWLEQITVSPRPGRCWIIYGEFLRGGFVQAERKDGTLKHIYMIIFFPSMN